MSLASVNTISAVKFDVTPSGGSATSREYIAARVHVQRLWRGQQWMTSDYTRHVYTEALHLVFTLSGSDIDQTSNTGDLKPPLELQGDLEDTDGFTVELYPDADQAKKFTVIAFNPDQLTALELEHMARVDQDTIRCITQSKVSRSDVEWFKKFE